MQRNDSINLAYTIDLLDSNGWIPRSKVGTVNQALFFVIQHADPEIINKYIPLFESAAKNDEIPRELYAKMYDRQQMYSGRPQRYGTQRVRKDPSTKEMVLWKIEDPENVNSLRKEMNLPPLEGLPAIMVFAAHKYKVHNCASKLSNLWNFKTFVGSGNENFLAKE